MSNRPECKNCRIYWVDCFPAKNYKNCVFYKGVYKTVFQKITQSPDVLAPRFIYTVCTSDGEQRWCSALLEVGSWFSEAEAIAATVARLKEIAK